MLGLPYELILIIVQDLEYKDIFSLSVILKDRSIVKGLVCRAKTENLPFLNNNLGLLFDIDGDLSDKDYSLNIIRLNTLKLENRIMRQKTYRRNKLQQIGEQIDMTDYKEPIEDKINLTHLCAHSLNYEENIKVFILKGNYNSIHSHKDLSNLISLTVFNYRAIENLTASNLEELIINTKYDTWHTIHKDILRFPNLKRLYINATFRDDDPIQEILIESPTSLYYEYKGDQLIWKSTTIFN